MSAAALVADLAGRGVILALDRGELKARGPRSVLTPDAVERLRAHKAELVAYLATQGAKDARDQRAANLDHDCGLAREDAERVRRRLSGREVDLLETWHAAVLRVKAAGLWSHLRTASLAFLESGFAADAVRLGWNERDLFAVFSGITSAIPIRVDALGLVTTTALAPFTYRILEIGPDHAMIETETGARHRARRGPPCSASVVWWRHPDITTSGSAS